MISEIWSYGRGFYKSYTENIDAARRIVRWRSVEHCSIYYTPSMRIYAYDFIFPTRSYNRVARVIGLSERSKLPGRVKQGNVVRNSNRIAQVKSSKLASEAV